MYPWRWSDRFHLGAAPFGLRWQSDSGDTALAGPCAGPGILHSQSGVGAVALPPQSKFRALLTPVAFAESVMGYDGYVVPTF